MRSPHEQQIEDQKKMIRFQMEEAAWLDSVVRPLLPGFLKRVVEARNGTWVGRILHLLTDVVVIGWWIGLKVYRNQDTVMLGGKGFRPGMDHGQKIANVRTTVTRRGEVFAQKTFAVGIIIKK